MLFNDNDSLKKILKYSLLIVLIILFINNFYFSIAHAESISYGNLISSSISTPGEVDTYNLEANAEDTIYVSCVKTQGDLWPKIKIISPTGKIAVEQSDSGNCKLNKKLMETGTYTVMVMDGFSGSFTGDYGLLFQRVPAPGNVETIKLASLMSSSIDYPGEIRSYIFNGNINDTLYVNIAKSSGDLWPKIVILSPSGNIVLNEGSAGNFDSSKKLTEKGTYLLMVMDGFGGTFTGNYGCTVNVLKASENGKTQPITPTTNSQATFTPYDNTNDPGDNGFLGTNSFNLILILASAGLLGVVIIAVLFIVFRKKGDKEAVMSKERPVKRKIDRSLEKNVIDNTLSNIPGSSHDVFISYSAEDKPIADAVCATLEARKIRCWIAPRDILPGKIYAQSILEAINNSKVFVLIFSSYSNRSPHVMREVENAVSAGLSIINFRIEDIVPTSEMKYYLGPIHWLDAITKPIETHIVKLSDTIDYILKQKDGNKNNVVEVSPETKDGVKEKT
jgi:hypothetical protein